jgi:glutamate synthase domain-containing protein 1
MQVRRYIPSGCATAGILHEGGERIPGDVIVQAIAAMHERSNGLGGGFVGYGIYPEMRDCHCLHLMFDREGNRAPVEELLERKMRLLRSERIPTRPSPGVGLPPVLWRYFVEAPPVQHRPVDENEDDYVVRIVMRINLELDGAYVVSSGKNMGVFKGVGYPEDIARFFQLERYQAYLWIAHARFPTNSPAWWGGAHPFSLLEWSVVHNGELSSYGINKRYVEQFGYRCTLMTDTEVLVYLLDLFLRRHNLPRTMVYAVLAPPFWEQIGRMKPPERRTIHTALRQVYGGGLANGPFSVIIGHQRGLIGLTDRIKLRPLVAAHSDEMIYLASEEAAIRAVCPSPHEIWEPRAGFPVEGLLRKEVAV